MDDARDTGAPCLGALREYTVFESFGKYVDTHQPLAADGYGLCLLVER